MTWPNHDQHAPYGPPTPPPRRTPWLAISLVAAAVVVLIVGIPVGVLVVRSAGSPPPATESTTPIANADDAPAVESVDPRPDPVEPAPVESAPAEPAGVPQTLTAGQQDLWNSLPMDGVDASSCRGYPPGESVTSQVVASIECRILDTGFVEPIYFYSFPDDEAVEEYIGIRAADADRLGECAAGEEYDGTWIEDDGFRLGRVVCIDNIKDGTNFFKMVWSRDGTGAVAVIQAESPQFVFDWWVRHGGTNQLSG